MKECVKCPTSDNILAFICGDRKSTVSEIKKLIPSSSEKKVYCEAGGPHSTETLAFTYETAGYHTAEHQNLKKRIGSLHCENKNNDSLKSEVAETFIHNLHPYKHHAQGV